MTVNVQFKDKDQTAIVSVFACPQDSNFYDFLGEVEEDDPRLTAFRQQFTQNISPSVS